MASSEPRRRLDDNQPCVTSKRIGGENKPDYRVLLYIPNIIGYIRLLFLLVAFCILPTSPASFVVFYSISIMLDGVDGYAARKLHQCSLFGSWFDVVLDNLSRGLLWTLIHPMMYLVSAIEWTAFVCNHTLGTKWQDSLAGHGEKGIMSSIVSCTLAKNFRNPWGVWVIAGLHGLPVWIIGYQYNLFGSHLWFLPKFVQPLGLVILGMGRLLCFLIEIWSIWIHISVLLVNTSMS
ncbi:hypothetical protein OTU49_002772 [Cherax quadricarinatus]|uniref:CDP-diacylglycerol--inositol 3-phosphatidyltransferase n=2 Tax=Cherax quadricarinatus TaxID=27406 RepID=A0AAW0XMJ2_CHEQU